MNREEIRRRGPRAGRYCMFGDDCCEGRLFPLGDSSERPGVIDYSCDYHMTRDMVKCFIACLMDEFGWDQVGEDWA